MKKFTSRQIEEMVGLKVNTLHYYVQSGAITPDIDAGDGRGSKRLFSDINVVEAVIIKRLIEFGLSKQRIVQALKKIQTSPDRRRLSYSQISRPNAGLLALAFDGINTDYQFIERDDPEAFKKIWKSGILSLCINLSVICMEYDLRVPWSRVDTTS